jgi:hypothetical protein
MPLILVDTATVVAMAERLKLQRILATDRGDFSLVRRRHCKRVRVAAMRTAAVRLRRGRLSIRVEASLCVAALCGTLGRVPLVSQQIPNSALEFF